MAGSVREDKMWAGAWLLLGIPAMTAGFVQGRRHDDDATMVGTVLVTVLIIYVTLPILRSKGNVQTQDKDRASAAGG